MAEPRLARTRETYQRCAHPHICYESVPDLRWTCPDCGEVQYFEMQKQREYEAAQRMN